MLPDFLTAVTGHACTMEEIIGCGERRVIIRPAYAVRQGMNPVQQALPGRAYGRPPRPDGPTRGATVNMPHMGKECLEEMRWTLQGAAPTAEKLGALGIDDVAKELWEPGI
jgi:aldehyde:ferredoxin oxidoreductase